MSLNDGYAVVGVDQGGLAAATITRISDGTTWSLTAISKPQQYDEYWTGTVLYAAGKVWIQWANGQHITVGFQRVDVASLPIQP